MRSFKRLDLALVVIFKRLDLVLVFGLLLLQLVGLIFVSIGTVFSVLAGNLNGFIVMLCIETVNLVDVALLAFRVEGIELVDRGDVLFVLVEQLSVFVLDLLLEGVVLFYQLLLVGFVLGSLGVDLLNGALDGDLEVIARALRLGDHLVLLVHILLKVVEDRQLLVDAV